VEQSGSGLEPALHFESEDEYVEDVRIDLGRGDAHGVKHQANRQNPKLMGTE
jgi:hypothetical protein